MVLRPAERGSEVMVRGANNRVPPFRMGVGALPERKDFVKTVRPSLPMPSPDGNEQCAEASFTPAIGRNATGL